ncbi:MAG: 2OG-Fe(II) oxygenase [Nitrospiraceae bacterium]
MTIQERLAQLDWKAIEASLWQRGYAKIEPLLTAEECEAVIALYNKDQYFRSRIEMRRFRFGEGEYKYLKYPLPSLVQALREHVYPRLAIIANAWSQALGEPGDFPVSHDQLLTVCRQHGQTKPTPLVLHYTAGGYNCLHQDLYGEVAFLLQLTAFLSRRDRDFTGGEFLLVEQRPRAQSRGEALAPEQGEIVIFATRYRPVRGTRGYYRVTMRHGVSTVHSGSRFTLGVIFHDAK